MTRRTQHHRLWQSRASFTLIELMIVMAVIALLASTVLFALYSAVEQAKAARTKAQIARLNELLMTRWESYRTRAVRLGNTPPGLRLFDSSGGDCVAKRRVDAIRELMRLEMPDRKTDVVDPMTYTPSALAAVPALARRYYRRAKATWTEDYQTAECLYMIVAEMNEIGGNGLDFLQEGEIGDVDSDGMPEILDGWGNPIDFIRWPYGFLSGGVGPDKVWNTSDDDPSLSAIMVNDPDNSPDPFDPLGFYRDANNKRYPALYPLIFSAGPDGKYEIVLDHAPSLNYGTLTPVKNNPYYLPPATVTPPSLPMGTPWDADGDGDIACADNITNHSQGD